MRCRLPGPQLPAQTASPPVRCASAPAANAATSSCRTWTHSILPWRRIESVNPFRLSPTIPYIRLTPAAARVSANWSATVFAITRSSPMMESGILFGSPASLPSRYAGLGEVNFFGDIRPDHLCGIDDAVELLLGNEAKLQRGSLEREIVVHRVMRNPGRLVVANHRRQRGDKHQGAVDIFPDLLHVWPGAFDQELAEICATVGHDCDRMRDVVDHQRLVDVHLE